MSVFANSIAPKIENNQNQYLKNVQHQTILRTFLNIFIAHPYMAVEGPA